MVLLLLLLLTPLSAHTGASAAAIATVISGAVSGTVMYLTKRSGDQATVKVAETTTRGQVEEEAYERARKALGDIIDRQAARITEFEARNKGLEGRVEHLEERVEHAEAAAEQSARKAQQYQRTARRLAKAVYELRHGGVQAGPDPSLDEAVIELLADEPD